MQADLEAIYLYIMFDFKDYVRKIISKSPSRKLVRLQGILKKVKNVN